VVVEAPKPEVVEVPKAPPVPNNGELVNVVPVLPKPGVAVEPKAGAELGPPKAGAELGPPKAGAVFVEPKAGAVLVEPKAGVVLVAPKA
jgi:hypothetical protein